MLSHDELLVRLKLRLNSERARGANDDVETDDRISTLRILTGEKKPAFELRSKKAGLSWLDVRTRRSS